MMVWTCWNATMTVMHSMWRTLAEKYGGQTETEPCWIMKTGDEIMTTLNKYDNVVPDQG